MIAFDIDNTLAQCSTAAYATLKHMGFEPDTTQTHYNLKYSVRVKDCEKARLVLNALFALPEFFAELEPMSRQVAGIINELHQRGHANCYVTARPSETYTTTVKWLKDKGFHLPLFVGVGAEERAQIALNRGCQVLVDDSPDNAKAALEAGLRVWMPRYPYNMDFTHPNLTGYLSSSRLLDLDPKGGQPKRD